MKKFYLLLLSSLCFLCAGFGQTVIDLSNGFDPANTFADNGWTVVNSSANKWVVGSTIYNSPYHSAYISRDSIASGPGLDDYDYDYNNAAPHVSHFYKLITIPAWAYNITVSFQLYGERKGTSFFDMQDGLDVYTDESLTPPVADALPGTQPGSTAVRQWWQFFSNPIYSGQTITLYSYYYKPTPTQLLLIFTWENNGDGTGDDPPASVDDLSLSYCIQSQDYSLTGGGNFCTGGTGVDVGLSGSVVGLSYQLFKDGNIVGAPLDGTGLPLDFGLQNAAGNYTVEATGTCSVNTMPGSVNVTVTAGPAAGTITSSATCSGGAGTLTLSGNSVSPTRWEYSADSTSASWTPIPNTGNTYSYSGITTTTFFRAVITGSCGTVYSSIGTVDVHNYWVGTTNTDWNTASNWSDGLVPSNVTCSEVYIALPSNGNLPVVGAAVPAITNLHVLANATVTINNTGTLTIGGTITESNAGSIIARNGTLNLNGSSAQTLPASTFLNDDLNNLIISNTSASGVTLGGNVNVYESLTYGASGTNVNTGGFLTLKSTKTETAWLGDMTGHTINGDVTVERYIATGIASPDHPKSWQFLAIPTQGQTIHQSWQENCAANAACVIGYGTQITGTGTGFDATSSAPSMKVYVAATNSYIGVSGTGIPIYNQKGYSIFVRGDRTVTNPFAPATETVLRTKGTLFTPANLPPVTTVNVSDTFESVGNPYASAIDMSKIGRSGDVISTFIVWDPRLGSQNGYGAYQYLTPIGSHYYATPGGTATYPGYNVGDTTGSASDYIQSGQAFYAQTTHALGGTVSFNESAKAGAGSNVLFTTPNPVAQTVSLLNTGLYQLNANGSTTIVDGALALFSDSYSNAIDALDARKIPNSAENLGIKTAGKLLAVTSRHTITAQDTLLFNLTGVSARAYRFHFAAENLDPSVQGYLVDNYTNSRTPLNMTGTTDADFTVVNVAGSYAANRFMIVFEPLKALPVTFTSIKAWKQDKDIDVQWRVDNEVNIKQYDVEKSTDGSRFTSMAQQQPTANNGGSSVYVIADANPVTGFNYYRVKSTGIDGKISYTTVVEVMVGTLKQDITIYPNPITDGMIHLQFLNEPAGRYKIRLLNNLGQVILQQQVSRPDGNGTEFIKWDYNLAHGMYKLEVTRPDGSVKDINVMY